MHSRSFAATAIGAILMIGSSVIMYSHFRPVPANPLFDGIEWDHYYSPAQKALAWTAGAGFLLFVAGLLSLAIDGARRLRKKPS
jgi:hypothetical protein